MLCCFLVHWLSAVSKRANAMQPDVEYTTNVTVVLESWWDSEWIVDEIYKRISSGHYQYVLTMLPDDSQARFSCRRRVSLDDISLPMSYLSSAMHVHDVCGIYTA